MSTFSTGQFPLVTGTMGKRYGERGIGGVVGEYPQNDSERQITFSLNAGEPMDSVTLTKSLPAGYRVTGIEYEVDALFVSLSTFTVTIGGGTVSGTNSLTAVTASAPYTAGSITNLTSVTAKDIVITPTSQAIGSATGAAKIVVTYKLL